MTEHKATPEVWARVESYGNKDEKDMLNCVLELRDRVEALEAAQRPNVRPELQSLPESTRLLSYRVENSALPIEEWGKGHTIVDSAKPAESNDPAEPDSLLAEEACNAFVQICKANSPTKLENETSAKPDSSLVQQVVEELMQNRHLNYEEQAVTAIHTIADWFDQKWMLGAAKRLRQEVG